MKLLFYTWNEITKDDLYTTLQDMSIEVDLCDYELSSYINDPGFVVKFEELLKGGSYDAIITFNFLPVISKIALRNKIPYISWIYDSPCLTMYSEMIHNPYNYIFHFDNSEVERIRGLGVMNIWHMPLGVNVKRVDEVLLSKDYDVNRLACDVSFMGNLYNNERDYEVATRVLSDRLKGYVRAIVDAAGVMSGGDLVDVMLTDQLMEEIGKHIKFSDEKEFFITEGKMFSEILKKQVSMQERVSIVKALSGAGGLDFKLFTNSDCSSIEGVSSCGIIDYYREMPHLFKDSKINLNITIRNIKTGIPLRAMDICGSGGFLLSSYSEELAYFFGEDEVAFYWNMADLKDKLEFYLSDEEVRLRMAEKAKDRVTAEFTYEIQLQKILDTVRANW